MNRRQIIEKVKKYVKEKMEGETTGHDWWHSRRVLRLSKKIAKKEGGDGFIIELAALLHDIADWKFNKKNESEGIKTIKKLLGNLKVEENINKKICDIIENISFKGAGVKSKMKTKEGKIVQDADRLDAIGAVGVARCFATGAKFNREIYNPRIKPKIHKTFGEYKNARSTSINHFHEKLLLLKDLINTKTSKKIAEKRHKFIERFLNQFFKEWEGKD